MYIYIIYICIYIYVYIYIIHMVLLVIHVIFGGFLMVMMANWWYV